MEGDVNFPKLHVFSDGGEWYIAESIHDAMQMQKECRGYIPADEDMWYREDDDANFVIWLDYNGEISEWEGTQVVGDFRTWIENYGLGFLCTTEH
jgi:hypothetical protein